MSEDRNLYVNTREGWMYRLALAARGERGSQQFAQQRAELDSAWRSPLAVSEDRNYNWALAEELIEAWRSPLAVSEDRNIEQPHLMLTVAEELALAARGERGSQQSDVLAWQTAGSAGARRSR